MCVIMVLVTSFRECIFVFLYSVDDLAGMVGVFFFFQAEDGIRVKAT